MDFSASVPCVSVLSLLILPKWVDPKITVVLQLSVSILVVSLFSWCDFTKIQFLTATTMTELFSASQQVTVLTSRGQHLLLTYISSRQLLLYCHGVNYGL